MDIIFFEKQVSRLCAQHALNMLLQGPHYSVDYLAEIAKDMDEKEKAVLSPEDAANFQSHNFDDSGYFSIQVIVVALQEKYKISLFNLDNPEVSNYKRDPSLGNAYICNLHEHWFTIRKFGPYWFILNSCLRGPKPITDTYLNLYMHEIANKGYSIFFVNGELPECPADNLREEDFQAYKIASATPPPTKKNMRDVATNVITLGDDEDEQLATAIAMSLGECKEDEVLYRSFANTPQEGWRHYKQTSSTSNFPIDVWNEKAINSEDKELETALQASYDEELNRQSRKSASAPPIDEYDEDLKRAIALSLSNQDMEEDKPCSSRSIFQQRDSQRHFSQSPVSHEKNPRSNSEWTTVNYKKSSTITTFTTMRSESTDISSRKENDAIRLAMERSLRDHNAEINSDGRTTAAFPEKNNQLPSDNF